MIPRKPQSENARLAELRSYNILDTEPEADFDDVVALVSKLLDVPVALISLVDEDRQWFKARHGFEGAETPLDQSICAHALLTTDGYLEVPDTRNDLRTADNPICCGTLADMQFYAGAALVAPSGHKLGTLCVLDRKPRELTPLQRETLQVMARQVSRQLDLRRALATETVLRDEIDHRVKNSLQTVNSLVRLFRMRAQHDETREVLEAVERRVGAVAELHGALYQGETRSTIPLDAYLDRVVGLLTDQAPEGVQVTAQVASIAARPSAAAAVAVIVNEFVANAFKHAFPEGGPGEVAITLEASARGMDLTCSDNGSGRAAGGDTAGSGIGMRLMEAACEQLSGEMQLEHDAKGYRLHVHVPMTSLEKSAAA
ncbi:histidine kinase dimerization/phosphoacceptor domain -containing protein [Pseudoponticoccus marisrubri]|uniref:Histidine kinase domain-containing protein n=1 Tax=Pseudoponticoccus marisrubri TaxID=1685382 RepID=A0A0W7WEA2_9RHOB|nr:histidine kinase dimerization/phosphoacceptor domain -containing protein [Pseudoponticoccus marisrubri]KUF08873.1 hypothetical protein AVJ23_20515 [Pseudoponticoccus marisrubri]